MNQPSCIIWFLEEISAGGGDGIFKWKEQQEWNIFKRKVQRNFWAGGDQAEKFLKSRLRNWYFTGEQTELGNDLGMALRTPFKLFLILDHLCSMCVFRKHLLGLLVHPSGTHLTFLGSLHPSSRDPQVVPKFRSAVWCWANCTGTNRGTFKNTESHSLSPKILSKEFWDETRSLNMFLSFPGDSNAQPGVALY